MEEHSQRLQQVSEKVAELEEKEHELDEQWKKYHNDDLQIERDIAVATTCVHAMEKLKSIDTNDLPFTQVAGAEDLDSLKKTFGLSNFASTELSQRAHIQIARALLRFGFKKSPAMPKSLHGIISTSNGLSVSKLREQTCALFGIEKPPAESSLLPPKTPSKKRTNSSLFESCLKVKKQKTKNSSTPNPQQKPAAT